jgi:signal transduction histidine kinase
MVTARGEMVTAQYGVGWTGGRVMKDGVVGPKRVLLVSALNAAEACAAAIMQHLGLDVDIVRGRREAMEALRAESYAAVIIEDSLAEGDSRGAELLWKMAGLAMPMQVNFALTGAARLVRDLRAALARREQERGAAERAALAAVQSELRNTVSGLVLQTQLALHESAQAPQLEQRLRLMAELAGSLKQRLEVGQA